jgi:hypothetical protein
VTVYARFLGLAEDDGDPAVIALAEEAVLRAISHELAVQVVDDFWRRSGW